LRKADAEIILEKFHTLHIETFACVNVNILPNESAGTLTHVF